jgi:hypothetical protein
MPRGRDPFTRKCGSNMNIETTNKSNSRHGNSQKSMLSVTGIRENSWTQFPARMRVRMVAAWMFRCIASVVWTSQVWQGREGEGDRRTSSLSRCGFPQHRRDVKRVPWIPPRFPCSSDLPRDILTVDRNFRWFIPPSEERGFNLVIAVLSLLPSDLCIISQ